MTVDEISDMSDDEWFAMSKADQVKASKIILDSLVSDGVAYVGDGGRYFMREDVSVSRDGEEVTVKFAKAN